jgi:hypothetical protein
LKKKGGIEPLNVVSNDSRTQAMSAAHMGAAALVPPTGAIAIFGSLPVHAVRAVHFSPRARRTCSERLAFYVLKTNDG